MKLIGKLKLINLKTNKCEKIYDYESLRADLNEKIRVKQMIDSGKYKLLCGCNDHEMRIKSNIYHIYIYTNKIQIIYIIIIVLNQENMKNG